MTTTRISHDWPTKLSDVPFDWVLIPLDGHKRPIEAQPDAAGNGALMDEWGQQPGFTPEELNELGDHVRAVGVLTGTRSGGLLAVDLDGEGSREKFQEITGHDVSELPRTISCTSGRHLRDKRFFVVDQDWWGQLRTRQIKNDSKRNILEFLWDGRQAVLAGDHPEDGCAYRWLRRRSPCDIELAVAPDWLLEAVWLNSDDEPAEPQRINSDDADRAAAMLQCLPAAEFQNYDRWLKVGMALHNVDPGLLATWSDWCQGMSNFDAAECLAKWKSFGKYKGTQVAMGSLHHWAKPYGYKEPKRTKPASQQPAATPQDLSALSDKSEFDAESALEILNGTEERALSRKQFALEQFLPPDLAAAVDLIQKPLPTDALSAAILLLGGYSGLLKIGSCVSSRHDHVVPINLFVVGVAPSGTSKSSALKKLVNDPGAPAREELKTLSAQEYAAWELANQGRKKDERKPPPLPFVAQLTNYTPAALTKTLARHEEKGHHGVLILRDELQGLFAEIEADAKRGTGGAGAQLLEAFDGNGYHSVRVSDGVRTYERCHVSIVGCTQPEVLRGLINDNDASGQFARFLFVQIPSRPLVLDDNDPTAEELQRYAQARALLQDYARRLFGQPPRTYQLSQPARATFHSWFHEHQQRASLSATPPIIQSLLGKTGAHALRLAGIIHLLQVVAGRVASDDRISDQIMHTAIAAVDQLRTETEAFHEHPETEESLILRHIHELSWNAGKCVAVDLRTARAKAGRSLRSVLKADSFGKAIASLERSGRGQRVSGERHTGGRPKADRYLAARDLNAA
jgi:hypothetical protein